MDRVYRDDFAAGANLFRVLRRPHGVEHTLRRVAADMAPSFVERGPIASAASAPATYIVAFR